ncbi:response regulator [Paenibacillus pasadenensis]|uniref:response regulator transcription factor n=1 Tax=Paenibacillus pasadenensis TaxID=217090 RepID=UPI00203B57C2|nr:response regulator [Paenibacillus pasadenensis]MCM3746907.1 response regulator [Paenibacillus pasadenensis]
MYKLIIADDEAVFREGLMNTIDWNRHGFELIGDCTNGREALEAVQQLKPDLVITDINMPHIDGLELAARIADQFPYIKIIIVTGYDQFDYAQQALRLKVHDFILKPITAFETRELLDRVRAQMDEEKRQKEDLSRLRSQLNQSLPLLRERFLERLAVHGAGAKAANERLDYFGLPRLEAPLLVALFDYDDNTLRSDAEPDRELLRFAGYNIIEEIVQREHGAVFRTREDRIAAIFSGGPAELLHERAARIAEEARYGIERYLGYTVTAGIGRTAETMEELPDGYRSASTALDYRFQYGKNRVLSIIDLEGAFASTPAMGEEWSRSFGAALRSGASPEITELIGRFVERLRQSRAPLQACQLEIQKALVQMMSIMQEIGVGDGGLESGSPVLFTEVYRLGTLDEVGDWLSGVASAAGLAAADHRNRLNRSQIGRALLYIEENYAEERISLQDICRYVMMSTSYFSQMFKQETGETFVEYLTRYRMTKAKELLEDTSLKFYEIAARVGYSDPNYFSLCFKKHVGQTMREYRELQTKDNR